MTKSLLSLVLMMTQFLSWSPSPLYLCLGNDGSFCIDFGPENCDCCNHSPADDECVTADGSCKHHDHANSTRQTTELDDSVRASTCDCTHIQISQPQNPTLVPSSVSTDAQRLVVFFATITCDLYSHIGVPPIDEAPTLLRTLHAPSLSLTVLASVIRRC